MSGAIEGMTTAATNLMRVTNEDPLENRTADPFSVSVRGITWKNELCIRLDWPWADDENIALRASCDRGKREEGEKERDESMDLFDLKGIDVKINKITMVFKRLSS
ncbi:uncharacterized protein PgNI_07903, partial [Pyricularia grisea]|uniref:Uncharacterized protein n=1 Tax=Pyricularia grisea TaxID=148305 RepID=A0A6P8B3M4_PYRGI